MFALTRETHFFSHHLTLYYGEIAERGVGPVLKEMALIALRLASLNLSAEEAESDSEVIYTLSAESKPRSLFDR